MFLLSFFDASLSYTVTAINSVALNNNFCSAYHMNFNLLYTVIFQIGLLASKLKFCQNMKIMNVSLYTLFVLEISSL